MAKCVLCGQEYKKITKSHLAKHGITENDYEIIIKKFSYQLLQLDRQRHNHMVVLSMEKLLSAVLMKPVEIKV